MGGTLLTEFWRVYASVEKYREVSEGLFKKKICGKIQCEGLEKARTRDFCLRPFRVFCVLLAVSMELTSV